MCRFDILALSCWVGRVLPGVTKTVSGAFDSLDAKNSRWGLGIDVQV